MFTLRNRLLLIAAMILASLAALFPRKVVERRVETDGSITYDTVRRLPLKQGLDLKGGMYLALEIDESKQVVADKSAALELALTVLRQRIDQFGVVEPNVQKAGDDRIIVELPDVDDEERALSIVAKQAFLRFQITDETNALVKVLPTLDRILKEKGLIRTAGDSAKGAAKTVDALGNLFEKTDSAKKVAAADSAQADTGFLGGDRSGPLSRAINGGGIPGEYVVALGDVPAVERYLSFPEIRERIPPGKELLWGSDTIAGPSGVGAYRALYMVDARHILTGDKIIDANPSQTPEGVAVQFKLNNEGGRRFRGETQRNIRNHMAIILDDRVMGQPPVIESAIGTDGQIRMGPGRYQDASDLALVLRAGALPVPLKVVEIRKIGPSLGADAIRQGMNAGILSVALVILIMVVYYRFSGMLAVLGLAFYALSTLAVLAGFNATLTLPGIAGFVLSIGMAVDANFLIFERIREEMAAGKSTRTAINEGFDHAWSAIVDTHVTTALTAMILYQFGTGPVRGFAVALLAGLAASMISAIFVVRSLFLLWLSRKGATQTLSI
jgi:preprotein translocase subunit SecD